jgi:hypothetical protein
MPPIQSRVSNEGTPRSSSPEHPIQLHQSETPNRPSSPPHTLSNHGPPQHDTTEEMLQATRNRIEKLEQMKRLRDQEKELLQALGLDADGQPAKRRRTSTPSSDSSGHNHSTTIKVKNLIRFTDSMTFRRRKEWLQDLQRAFSGDPKRFSSDVNKILFALDQMDEQPRNRWYSHCGNLSTSARSDAENDWDLFEEWTKECVKDLADQVSTVAKQLNSARQREYQSPLDFHHYLESLEDQFDRQDDKSRALSFYTKLSPALIRHIDLYIHNKPETREAMVKLASQIWQSMKQSQKPLPRADSKYSPPNRGPLRGKWHHQPSGNHGKRKYDDIQDDNKTPKPQRNSDEAEKSKPGSRCYICDSPDHWANHCPDKGKSVNQYRGDLYGKHRGNRGSRRGNGR